MRNLLLIFLFLLLVSCTPKIEKTQVTPLAESVKEVFNSEEFMIDLSENIDLDFTSPGPIEFSWKIAGEKLGKMRNLENSQVSGFATALMDTPMIEKESNMPVVNFIADYFSKKGFKKNVYNSVAGTVSGTEAFEKNQAKCLINWEIIGGVNGYQNSGVPMNIVVVCGEAGE